MRLHEIENSKIEKIKKILFEYFKFQKDSEVIDDDGKITVNSDCYLTRYPGNHKLPVMFEKVLGSFNIAGGGLISLDGCPKIVRDKFIANNNSLQSLDGLPESTKSITISYTSTLPLLKLLFVKNLINIDLTVNQDGRLRLDAKDVKSILIKYLGQGRKGAILATAELTRAGFKSNARL